MAEIKDRFRVPPEVPRYFADKGLKPAFSWLDVWGQEHAYAFTVAKAVDAELLGLFKSSIQRAIDKGEGFETWRKQLLPELQRLGWAGKRMVDDPTGQWKSKEVDFTAPRRLQTIFWSNMRAARAAGQWERIQRTKKGLPYLLYSLSVSERKRPQHRAWVGTILHADDPWWSTHFPPNGWHCKCSVRQITGREADSLTRQGGYSREAPPVNMQPFVNRRTGEIMKVPEGIDPGWGGNPGLNRVKSLTENLLSRLDEAGPVAAKSRLYEWMQSGAAKLIFSLPLETGGDKIKLPIAVWPDLAKRMRAKTDLVVIFHDTLQIKEGNKDVSLDTFMELADKLDQGIVVDQKQQNRLSVFINLAGENRSARWYRVIIKRNDQGYMRIITVHRDNDGDLEKALKREREGHDPLTD